MAVIKVPFDRAGDLTGSVPPGKYVLKIAGAGLGETQKGDPKLLIKHVIVAPKKYKGMPVTIGFNFNEIGLALLRQAITAATGKEVPKKAQNLDTKALVGKQYQAEAYTSKRDGAEYLNWRNFRSLKAVDDEEPEDDNDGLEGGEEDETEDDDDGLEFDDEDDD